MKLYHATFKYHLESIKQYGLGGNIVSRNHDISDPTVSVYLSEDYEECEIMIEDSDTYRENNLTVDDIVLLEVSYDDLDDNLLYPDSNLNDEDHGTTSWEYYGIIPFTVLKIVNMDII